MMITLMIIIMIKKFYQIDDYDIPWKVKIRLTICGVSLSAEELNLTLDTEGFSVINKFLLLSS